MPQWPVPAANGILVGGLPLFHEYETIENIYPGYVVSYTGSTSPVDIQACAFGEDPVGVAIMAMADQEGHGSWRKPDCDDVAAVTRDLPYQDNDQVKVVSGPVFVMLVLDASQTLVPGDKVQCSASTAGMVEEFYCDGTTADPCDLLAESMEHVVTAAGECEYFMAKLLI